MIEDRQGPIRLRETNKKLDPEFALWEFDFRIQYVLRAVTR